MQLQELKEELAPIQRNNSLDPNEEDSNKQKRIQRDISLQYGAIAQIQKHVHSLRAQLRLKKVGVEVLVSDHAIIRYYERILGLNIEEARKHILGEDIEYNGDGKYEADGLIRVVENNVIVTVYAPEEN